ncbi:MAG: SpoIID/LytB domain-containing protein [Myxococcaceae bacterium]|nr:SpoIID/LytB domain-containing protein [Myxococcaceae bacterium]MBH2006608.1 SpoIID/LytB domain-containing protein [Myxococcaceae bacterium]
MKYFVLTLLFAGSLFAEPEVRIMIESSAKLLKIGSDTLTPGKTGIVLNGKERGTYSHKIEGELLSYQGRQFRNHLEVRQSNHKLTLTHTLPMEAYITGVISSELPNSWPLEVLKAQAIAARTYAIWQMYRKEHLESSVLDQVYHGVHREHALAKQAVEETAGQVLTYDSKPAHTYFHACCGGHTASSLEVFGSDESYLQGVECRYCRSAPTFRWSYSLSRSELDKKLGSKIKDLQAFGETQSGRIKSFRFKSKPQLPDMKGTDFRRAIGYNALRSTLITKTSFGWRQAEFKGRGHGHGVGMCQWGALGMAKLGKEAKEILELYYPGTEVRKLY